MVTPGLGPGYAVGKKGKKRSQIGKISASQASQAVRSPIFFFFFRPRRFSPPFSPDSSPVVSKLSLLILKLFTREALGLCARGRWEGFLSVIPFVKEPVLVFYAKY